MVRWTSESPLLSSNRVPPIASISSINMMQAFFERAILKISLTSLAPSPIKRWTNSEAMTLMKQASVRFATARAAIVLPVPGGPYSNTPLGGSIPRLINLSGSSMGSSTTSRNFSICSLSPPRSSYVMSGFSSTVIRETVRSIFLGRGSVISYFWPVTPTRAPSSMSLWERSLLSPTTNLAIWRMLMSYLGSSFSSPERFS
mmetsp:Transcript_8787/g.19364  ORF Transcript_8787/g.19364 Transcript_8787/m.19364 type:complete len:201 (+) Transcript_8787:492-1094(+)